MQIEFTTEQAQKAISLLDLAVKAGGLNASAAALEIAQLIQAAMQAEQESKRADDHAITRSMLAAKQEPKS